MWLSEFDCWGTDGEFASSSLPDKSDETETPSLFRDAARVFIVTPALLCAAASLRALS